MPAVASVPDKASMAPTGRTAKAEALHKAAEVAKATQPAQQVAAR